jgi:serine/threonine-protein kinase HipA
VGALQFLHPEMDPGLAGVVNGAPVSDHEIAEILANLGTSHSASVRTIVFRISLAGAQEKTALLYWQERWHKPNRTTATTHILKPSIGRLSNGLDLTHSVENEFLCLKLLESFDLPAAKARMAQYGGRSVLIVERFDRAYGPRTSGFCGSHRKIVARHFPSLRHSSTRATGDPASRPSCVCRGMVTIPQRISEHL